MHFAELSRQPYPGVGSIVCNLQKLKQMLKTDLSVGRSLWSSLRRFGRALSTFLARQCRAAQLPAAAASCFGTCNALRRSPSSLLWLLERPLRYRPFTDPDSAKLSFLGTEFSLITLLETSGTSIAVREL